MTAPGFNPDDLAPGSGLLTTKVIEIVEGLMYHPRKIYGVTIEAASERTQDSPKAARFQTLEQKEKKKN